MAKQVVAVVGSVAGAAAMVGQWLWWGDGVGN